MRLEYVLWIYVLIFISIFLGLIRCDKEPLNSLFLAMIIGLIYLFIVKLPNDVSLETDNISAVFIYFAIVTISFIAIIIYSGIMAYNNLDKRKYISP